MARFVAKKNLGVKEFEFSQNYAMYFDKLERINYFLQDSPRWFVPESRPTRA